jgi:hypothetical protein
MNISLKTAVPFAILGLILQPNFARAEGSSSASAQNQTASAKSPDQPDARNSTTESRSDSMKEPSVSAKEDPADSHPVVALQGPALFKLLDTDKDGRISRAEFAAYGKTADTSTGSEKTSPGGDKTQARRIKDNPPDHKAEADHPAAAVPKPPSPGPSILPSASTRASRFTAEVFEILDIDHDKFLTQKELDALIGAHQISQP